MVASRPLRIAFFGTPAFAVPTLEALVASRHRVVAVVSQPDRPKGRGHKLQPTPTRQAGEAAGVEVLQPERIRTPEFLERLAGLDLDLGVVAAYGKILPDALLALPRLGLLNVHASLLPEYRGAAPVHRAVIDGRRTTGVTIMRVVSELDAGPMLAKAEHPIGPDDTSIEVERALAALGAPLLVDAVDALAAGAAAEDPQDHARATYAPKIARQEGTISWTLGAARIHNLVRGLQPWPLVSARLAGERCLVHRTRMTGGRSEAPAATVIEASDRLAVACADGEILEILQLQPEGRRVMAAREFLAGRAVRPGSPVEPG